MLSRKMPYYSPAVLFRAPYTLPAGKSLTLRYRILIDTEQNEPGSLSEAWKAFAEE